MSSAAGGTHRHGSAAAQNIESITQAGLAPYRLIRDWFTQSKALVLFLRGERAVLQGIKKPPAPRVWLLSTLQTPA
jgi:hypothetical protein